PNVARMLSAGNTDDENYQWRVNERWPHFRRVIADNPWFGIGTDVDPSLGADANTPHNGYLSEGVEYGVPAVVAIVAFALLGIRDGLRGFRRNPERDQRILLAALASGIIGLLAHNYTEATFELPFIFKGFWLFIGTAAVLSRHPERFADGAQV